MWMFTDGCIGFILPDENMYNFFPKWNWYLFISMCLLCMRYHTSFVMRILWKFKWISADKALVSECLTSFQDTTRHLKPSDILFDTQLTASGVSSGCQVSLIEMSQSRSHLFACSAHRRFVNKQCQKARRIQLHVSINWFLSNDLQLL